MTTYIYCRLSENKTGESVSLAYQEAECRAFAQKRGIEISGVLKETISATSGKKRMEFERLLTLKPSQVIAYRVDRVTRSMKDLLRLADAGISVTTIDGQAMDFSSANGRFMAQMFASIAELETSIKSERQKSANRHAAESGKHYLRIRPFGHNLDGTEVKEEADAIREGVRMYLEDSAGLTEISRMFNERGLRTVKTKNKGGKLFTATHIRQLFVLPNLCGQREYDGVRRDLDGWVKTISPEDFDAVQLRLNSSKRDTSGWSRSDVSLLSTIMLGPDDQPSVSYTTGRLKVKRYRTHIKGHSSILASVAEEKVWQEVQMILLQPGAMTVLFPEAEAGSRSKLITKKLKLEAEHNARIDEAIEEGLSIKILGALEKKRDEALEEINQKILETESANLFAPFFTFEDGKISFNESGEWGADPETLREIWEAENVNKKREMLKILFDRIEYTAPVNSSREAGRDLKRVKVTRSTLAEKIMTAVEPDSNFKVNLLS